MGEVEIAVKESIDEAVERGIIDRKLHAAPIAVMLKTARTIDLPTFPMVEDRYDNVSVPTLLRYMQSMGLTLQDSGKAEKDEKKPASKLAGMKSRARGKLNVV